MKPCALDDLRPAASRAVYVSPYFDADRPPPRGRCRRRRQRRLRRRRRRHRRSRRRPDVDVATAIAAVPEPPPQRLPPSTTASMPPSSQPSSYIGCLEIVSLECCFSCKVYDEKIDKFLSIRFREGCIGKEYNYNFK